MASNIVSALISYARESKGNLEELKGYRATALADIAANKGGHLVSATGNGISATVGGKMTNDEWFSALQHAITTVSRGFGTGRSYARF